MYSTKPPKYGSPLGLTKRGKGRAECEKVRKGAKGISIGDRWNRISELCFARNRKSASGTVDGARYRKAMVRSEYNMVVVGSVQGNGIVPLHYFLFKTRRHDA